METKKKYPSSGSCVNQKFEVELLLNCEIIADSCCDMTPQLKERLGIVSVPLTMRLGQKEFTDDSSLDIAGFMAEMKACKESVGSASPATVLYQEAMEKAQNSFVVTLSGNVSGSYASAMVGKAFAQENGIYDTHIFDSKSASAGEVLVAIKIRELLQKGMTKENIIQAVNRFIENMKTYCALDRCDNLLKNGRLNRVTERLLAVLNLKLILGSDGNGNFAMYAKVRGKNQMIDKLTSFIKDSGKKTDGENLVITHCNNPGLAGQLAASIEQMFRFKEIFIIPAGGISSVYLDDKGIAMAF